ncbi:alkylation response protein AidB-like acyl-CoA dehydrogenase [Bacillus pakistanensis]|uniref:Alkylation response protein AidB-like acyl-CoA dehydrogenase n=1 Tax=Rossellomorea pakistanensis TaxID=992288 RepID=A0ABS2NIT9_9BACI|nr:acyl-CoA dehydrogenase family protein [Bacillus pakistanensis]MBM7587772.1 alkylation response protein AidB-like acyl-CoA dehydrogenase [Bacillus pakistanensis]
MSDLYKPFIKTKKQEELLDLAGNLADQFAERAEQHDRDQVFPMENFQDLKGTAYPRLTVPKEFGGEEISLYEFVLIQERLAQGDASTALSIGWHLGSFMELGDNRPWDEKAFQSLCEQVVEKNSLINRAATEPATGSPTRGGLPQTKAIFSEGKWSLSGRKTFTSMAKALDYSVVSATLNNTEEKGWFLVDHRLNGVSIEETWDTISMQGTGSDDLVLKEVILAEDALVERDSKVARGLSPKGWLLHIPACYLGVALAARNHAIQFAKEYHPNSLPGPIKDVPEVQRKIGEIELELFKSRQLLYSVAEKWANEPEKRAEMGPELAAVKHVATNSASHVVDIAMRLVGARSLFRSNPMQRYYRDVRAGLHNPPMDDSVITMLSKKALMDE